MRTSIVAMGGVAAAVTIGTGIYIATKTSQLPAPLVVISVNQRTYEFDYSDTNTYQWINVGVERSTNLVNWTNLYTWRNLTSPVTHITFTDECIYPNQFYRAYAQWTNEQFRPPGY